MTAPRPNTFLIGAPKCGTTALAQYLSDRADVFLGYPKEPSFWSSDLTRSGTVLKLGGLDNYLAIYADAGNAQIVLDASTRYLLSDVAVPAILAFDPAAKFIVMLRHPVEMAQAYHMEKHFNLFEDQTEFEAAWRLQDARLAGDNIPPACPEPKELQYRDVAALGTQLARAMDRIPMGQLLVLFQDDLQTDPRAVWLRVLDFLGLPDDGRTDFPVVGGAHFNRFPWLAKLYQNPPAPLQPLIRTLKKSARGGQSRKSPVAMLKSLLVKRGKRAALSPGFRAELDAHFAPEIDRIEALTGRDLSHWRPQ